MEGVPCSAGKVGGSWEQRGMAWRCLLKCPSPGPGRLDRTWHSVLQMMSGKPNPAGEELVKGETVQLPGQSPPVQSSPWQLRTGKEGGGGGPNPSRSPSPSRAFDCYRRGWSRSGRCSLGVRKSQGSLVHPHISPQDVQVAASLPLVSAAQTC